jgi:4-hydroxybenzoate polyprenyltransferase
VPVSLAPLQIRSGVPKQRSDPLFIVKVARPGFWLTSIWFYMLPLGGRNVFGTFPFWLGLIYVTFPLGFVLYGWNDLVDYESDRFNPRKGTFLFGARGTPSQLAVLPVQIAVVQSIFLLLFWAILGSRALLWFACLVAATAIYNWPGRGTKGRPLLDLLTQAGYLLVFVLSSWLNHVPQLPWFGFVFGALFAMHSHLFGEVMDFVPDGKTGRRTTAACVGVVRAKFLIAAFLLAEGLLILRCARDPFIGAFLLFSAFWFVLDAAVLWQDRPYSSTQMRFFLLGWNAAALVSLPFVWASASLTTGR